MKRSITLRLLGAAVIMTAMACSHSPFVTEKVPLMSAGELKARMGKPDTIILDVRTGSDWTNSDQKIKGAERTDPKEFNKWADVYPKNATIVFYCA